MSEWLHGHIPVGVDRRRLYPMYRIAVKGELRNSGEKSRPGFFLARRCVGDELERSPFGADLETALGTADPVRAVQQELAADRTLEAGPPQDRDELLVERPVKQLDRHSVLNTPVTLPRI
jgi:hypothetical protein